MTKIQKVELLSCRVSPKSEWLFVKVECADGFTGVGEATMEGHEEAVKIAIRALDDQFKDRDADPNGPLFAGVPATPENTHRFTAISALEQALWDAEGKRQNRSVASLLGGSIQDCRLYANINRGISDRSPEGFASAARTAKAAGFTALKIAPFDGLDWSSGRKSDGRSLYDIGLERIAAVRAEVQQDCLLSIDCHWRFDLDTSTQLIKDTAEFSLYWIECPISETIDAIPDLVTLRRLCNDQGVLLAGLECLNGVQIFSKFIDSGAMDIVMPDVKYAGGLEECRRIAKAAAVNGLMCSPHNPTGPVCHAASLHVASTLPNCPILEHQFQETPLFETLIDGRFPALIGGRSALPAGPGFGVTLRAVKA